MSHLLLAGNHKAESEQKGHNGKPSDLVFQNNAFIQACRAYQALKKAEVGAALYTLIDHKGGVRELTGRRNNEKVLNLSDLHPEFSDPFKAILEAHDIPRSELQIIPEKTLKDHEMALLEKNVFDESGKCRALNIDGNPACRGLAGAYMDFTARREQNLGNSPSALDWFVELLPPVPSAFTYIQGTQIYRMGMVDGEGILSRLKIRGWDCTEGQLRLLQFLKPEVRA